jgi:hypothetical protein
MSRRLVLSALLVGGALVVSSAFPLHSVAEPSTRQAMRQARRALSIDLRQVSRLRGGSEPDAINRTGIVIDAGSSGSRAYVFRWQETDPAGTMIEIASLRLQPGVSKHARQAGADAAAASLAPLLEFVLRQPDVVPAETPVHFMATAGMRLLEPAMQRDVLTAVERLLEASPFRTPPRGAIARVLSGEEEALYDWLAVNTALRLLGGEAEATASVADLGGASTQLSFAAHPDCVSATDGELLAPFGRAHVLGVSRLGLGMNEALANMLRGPSQGAMGACLAPGARAATADGAELVGTGAYDGCRAAIRVYLANYEVQRHGARAAPPTLPAEAQWPLYLFDNFPKGAAILRNSTDVPAEQTLTLAQLETLGRDVCAVPHDASAYQQPRGIAQERSACFLGAYIVELLHGTYGFPLEPAAGSQMGVLKFVTELNGFSMNWPLGAMVHATMAR